MNILLSGCADFATTDLPPTVKVYHVFPENHFQNSKKEKFPKKRSSFSSKYFISTERCYATFPNRYMLIIGISDYKNLPSLPYVENDVSLLHSLATCYLGVPKKNIKILKNPTLNELKLITYDYIKNIKLYNSLIFVYFSGHGILDSNGRFYLLPSDVIIKDEKTLKASSIDIDNFVKILDTNPKVQKLVIVDACRKYSFWKPAVFKIDIPASNNVTIIYSTKPNQVSAISKDRDLSAFVKALYLLVRSGIKNLDFDNNGFVDSKEMWIPLKNKLKDVSFSEQTPECYGKCNIPLFPIVK